MFESTFIEKKTEFSEKFSQYPLLNTKMFEMLEEMVTFDYTDISYDKRKIHAAFDFLVEILTAAFEEAGSKAYLKAVTDVILQPEIFNYLKASMGAYGETFAKRINAIKYEIIYWQGCEGVEHRKLQKILEHLEI